MFRTIMVILLVMTTLSGCLESEPFDTQSTQTMSLSEQQTIEQANDPALQEKPPKRFEPVLTVDISETIVEKGDNVTVSIAMTDLDDYPYPLSFIDWALEYDHYPDALLEGDGFDLPAQITVPIFREGVHNFTLRLDDGQGLEEERLVATEVPIPDLSRSGVPFLLSVGPTQEEFYFLDACMACDGNGNAPNNRPGHTAGVEDYNLRYIAVPPAYQGAPYDILSTGTDPRVQFLDACGSGGTPVDAIHFGNPDGQVGMGAVAGQIPDGAACMAIWEGIYGTISATGPYTKGVQGGKMTVAMNADAVFDDEGLCWTGDFVLIGSNLAGQGIYQTDFGWAYVESNGVPGLQWNNDGPGGSHVDECTGGDTVLA